MIILLCVKERKGSKESQCVSTSQSAIIIWWSSGLKGIEHKPEWIFVTADFVSFFLGWDTFLTCVGNELPSVWISSKLGLAHSWMHLIPPISDTTTTANQGLPPSGFKGKQVLLLLSALHRSGNNFKTRLTLQTHCEYSTLDNKVTTANLVALVFCLDLGWFGFFSEMELRWNVTLS